MVVTIISFSFIIVLLFVFNNFQSTSNCDQFSTSTIVHTLIITSLFPSRDKLLPPHTGPPEYRFNGRAHVTMAGRGYLTPQKNQILLFFRTYAPDGLIYLVGEGAYFFSVQMQDGRVFLQVRY